MSVADLIFTGGPIITVDPTFPDVEALAVTDGRIMEMGRADQVMASRGPVTEVVDLAGRALLPGFVEAHGHPTQEQKLFSKSTVDIRPVTLASAEKVESRIMDELDPPSEEPLLFNGLDLLLQKGFPEPTREWLDERAGTRPVVVTHNSGHAVWANTAAIHKAGLPLDQPDPPGGHFERDENDLITGKAYEAPAITLIAGWLIYQQDPDPIQRIQPLADLHKYMASRGLTTCADLGFSDEVRPLVQTLYDQELAKVRMRVYEMSNPSMCSKTPVKNGDDLFSQIGIKLWVDGSPWLGNIATTFPYLNTDATTMLGLDENHIGGANYTQEQLRDIVEAYFPAGWQMSCHVHGDAGVKTILDVYEDLLCRHPRDDHRLRLEHCGAMTAEQYQRAAALGVTCSLFSDHLYYWGEVLVDDLFGPEHGAPWMRARSALDAGVRISLHNDAPVTPDEPLRNMSVAITRTTRNTGRVLAPEECITFDEALRAQTIDAAYQLFTDDITGSLTPGKYADLVILEQDPRQIDPAELADLPIHATYLAGEQTYDIRE